MTKYNSLRAFILTAFLLGGLGCSEAVVEIRSQKDSGTSNSSVISKIQTDAGMANLSAGAYQLKVKINHNPSQELQAGSFIIRVNEVTQ
ncbi:MAG: hypothetical protein ACK5P6_02115 [Pseudobdellovibrionaceae bacterium]